MATSDRTVLSYLVESIIGQTASNAVAATGTFNYTTNPVDGETVTIDAKTYTFQTTLTDVDGHVTLGANRLATFTNLANAINKSGGVIGTDYAASTTVHPTVSAGIPTQTTLIVTAKTAGSAGNSIVTTDTCAHGAWNSPTLTGGLDFTMARVRYTGESLKYDITNTKSSEIRPDRTQTDTIQTGSASNGAINFELSYDSFVDFLSGALCAEWTAGTGSSKVLVNGSIVKSFTIQKDFQDAATPTYHTYSGMVIESMNLKFAIGKIVDGSFSFMGLAAQQSNTPIAGAVYGAVGANPPMNSAAEFQNFTLDGVPFTGCLSTMNLTVKNNARAIQCMGTLGGKDVRIGELDVTGDLSLYFTEGTNYGKYLSGTAFAMSFDVVDTLGNKYTLFFPRLKYESGEVVAGGQNSDVMFAGKFRALYDSVTGVVMKITATPHP